MPTAQQRGFYKHVAPTALTRDMNIATPLLLSPVGT